MKFLNEIDGAKRVKQDSNNRFVTDGEKQAWSAKETTTGSQDKANQAEQNAKDYTDSELANFEGMVEHGNEYHSVPYAKESDLVAHKAEKATESEYGHLRLSDVRNIVDDRIRVVGDNNVEIFMNGEWVRFKIRKPDDYTDAHGSKFLISGTMEEGFFGEVPASEFITGDALASECGISQGISQYSTEPWLKFAYKGEIQFVAKKTIRRSISWNAINAANCAYDDSGTKTVTIDGLTYKVTLMRGLDPSNDPKTNASGISGAVIHHSEWNRLMGQIHEEAINKSWSNPGNIESDIGILEHSLGSGSQGMYSNTDLLLSSGGGRYSWVQELSSATGYHMYRGFSGVSYSGYAGSDRGHVNAGWRPVLRLVEEV